ncbi:S-adenosyl-L-methionine-dependent methyltransferase [Cladochytrium replicatum]|nr:S-adenosyl-L-methionine-dependent methyltransferase [Cladochytrium replicatum]
MRIQVEHIVLLSVATLLVVSATYLANFPSMASLRSSAAAAQQGATSETLAPSAPDSQNPSLKTVTPSEQQNAEVQSRKTFEWISDRFRTKVLDMAAREVILENKTEVVHTRWSGPSFPIYVHPSPDLVSDVIRKNGGWYDCYTHLDSLEKILADPTRPNVVIDVGGNIGSCALMYGALGFKVFSFEPAEHNFRLFSASIKTNVENGILNKSGPKSVTLYPLGASDVDDVKNIYIQQGNNGNSIISSIEQDGTQFDHESIITAQVSNIVRERVGFAKLDCQGYEPYALRGMKALIETQGIDQITFELDPQFFKAVGVTNPIETLQFLDSMGYTIVRANGITILRPDGFANFIKEIAATAEDLKAYSNKIFPVIPPPN